MAEKITAELVESLEAPATGSKITYDTTIKGFGVRVTSRSKTFILNYRTHAGRERRYTIGTFKDTWTVLGARKVAKELKQRIASGEDPQGDKGAAKAAPTVRDLADVYIEDHLPKKRESSRRNDKAVLDKIIIPKLGARKVTDIGHADIEALHRSLRETPYQANRVAALASKMFRMAIKKGWITTNPVAGLDRFPEERRERFLSQAEIGRLTAALAGYHNQSVANAIRLLLLTGSRKAEVLTATWDQFDLDAGVWVKPSAHTKQKKRHRVPLSAPAKELLVEIAKTSDGDYVFPGRRAGEPLKEIKTSWAAICKTAELEGVRVHDLRHSYASILASAGLSLPIIGQLLGHTQVSTTARYSHLYDQPLREATERVAAAVENAAKPAAEVIKLQK